MSHIRRPQRGRKPRGEILEHRCRDGTWSLRLRYQLAGERQYEKLFEGDVITDENLEEYRHRAKRIRLERQWEWSYRRRNPRRAPSTSEAAEAFLGWCAQHREPGTVHRYTWAIERFADEMPAELARITDSAVLAYRQQLLGADRDAGGINNEFIILHRIWRWWQKQGWVEHDPFEDVEPLRDPRSAKERRPRRFSAEEVEVFRRIAPAHVLDPFNVSLWTGLRRGELIWLDAGDVDLEHGLVHVVSKPEHRVKDQEARAVELWPQAEEFFRQRLRERPEGPIFEAPRAGGRFHHMSSIVRYWIRKAGIRGATLKTCRATFATVALERGTSLRLVQAWMGHSNIRTTEKYLGLPAGVERKLAAERLEL